MLAFSKKITVVLLVFLLAGCVPSDKPQKEVLGWKNVVTLKNKHLELTAVPDIARIMSFRRTDGNSLFWFEQRLVGRTGNVPIGKGKWTNYGGSKLWVAPQSVTRWPPDPVTDGGKCTTAFDQVGVLTMTGKTSRESGFRMDRVIRLLPGKPVAEVTFRMNYSGDEPKKRGLWHIVQVLPWGRAICPIKDNEKVWGNRKDAYLKQPRWEKIAGAWMLKFNPMAKPTKFFAMQSAGWLAYELGGEVFVMSYKVDTKQEYPEGDSPTELFCSKDYIEMEHVSPSKTFHKGDSLEMKEYWHALKVNPKLKDAKLLKYLTEYMKKFREEQKSASSPQP